MHVVADGPRPALHTASRTWRVRRGYKRHELHLLRVGRGQTA